MYVCIQGGSCCIQVKADAEVNVECFLPPKNVVRKYGAAPVAENLPYRQFMKATALRSKCTSDAILCTLTRILADVIIGTAY